LGQGFAKEYAAHVLQLQRRYPEAMEESRQALDLYQAAGDRKRQGAPLAGIGLCHTRLGNHRRAIYYCSLALALHQETGDRPEEGATWATLGHAHLGLADHARSAICYRHAVEIFRDVGDLYREAFCLSSLGDTHHAAGDTQAATAVWRQALIMLDDLRHPDAERVRSKLARLHGAMPG
jgi:tetratricopeptide (TPR) repeat protein